MAKLILFLSILIFFVSNTVFCDEASANEVTYAVELSAENFDEAIQKNNHFVMFFAPWCGHCKRLHPLWEQLAELMNVKEDANVIIAKVDCTQHQGLCAKHEVTGYPTLRFFKLGEESSVKFKGTRDMPAITEFINQQLNAEEEKKIEDIPKETSAEATKQTVYELTEDNFAQHVSSGNHFVKFYAPWCSHCQRLAPTWEKLGENLRTDNSISISKIDCTVHRPICQDFEVKGYPTLLWIEDGKKIEKYSGSRDIDALEKYIHKMLGNIANADEKPEPPKATPVDSPKIEDNLEPLQLSSENFSDTVEKGITFVKFYAPWCGHCKKLSPTWDQLAAKLHPSGNIKIAKVDCTENDNKNLCMEQQVEGYPTLFAYKNGVKQTEYDGGRDLSDLQHYITRIFGHTEL